MGIDSSALGDGKVQRAPGRAPHERRLDRQSMCPLKEFWWANQVSFPLGRLVRKADRGREQMDNISQVQAVWPIEVDSRS